MSLTRQEFLFAPALNMVLLPVPLLSGILLPMRDVFLGRYATGQVFAGALAVVVLAVLSVTVATRMFLRENA